MFGRLAMGFANVRAGTRALMLVLVQARVHGASRERVKVELFHPGTVGPSSTTRILGCFLKGPSQTRMRHAAC